MTWTTIEAEWAAMTRRIRADRDEAGPAPRAPSDGALRATMPAPGDGATARPGALGADDGLPAIRG